MISAGLQHIGCKHFFIVHCIRSRSPVKCSVWIGLITFTLYVILLKNRKPFCMENSIKHTCRWSCDICTCMCVFLSIHGLCMCVQLFQVTVMHTFHAISCMEVVSIYLLIYFLEDLNPTYLTGSSRQL